jgi:hypothetical protein
MNLSPKIQLPEPQYLIEASGKKSHVILTIDEYNRLIQYFKEGSSSDTDSSEKQESRAKKNVSLKGKKAIDFYGILKSDHPEYVKQITEDKDIFYDI